MSACDQILFKKQLTLFPPECVYDLIGNIDGCERETVDVHCIYSFRTMENV